MRVLIAGSSKTGSTALAYRLKAALTDHQLYFEPYPLSSVPRSDQKAIVKFLLGIDPSALDDYDRCVLLVRHPFDIIVSQTLFLANGRIEFLTDALPLACLRILHQIEERQAGIGLRTIWENCTPATERRRAISGGFRAVCAIHRAAPEHLYVFRYEELCSGKFDGLSAYLGVSLVTEDAIQPLNAHVARTRGIGDWKNWLDEEDVGYFRAIPDVAAYAETFGYDLSFDPGCERNPEPKTGSEYFSKIVDLTRMIYGAPRIDPSNPMPAAGAPAYLAAADSLDRRDDEAAFAHAVTAVCQAPNRAGYFNMLAACCYRRGKIEAARAATHAAIALDPSLPFSWSLLAGCHARAGEMAEALDALARCTSLAPPGILARFGVATRLFDNCAATGNWAYAEDALRRLIASSRSPEYRTLLAETLSALGRHPEALAEIDAAIANGDASLRAHRHRARALSTLGRWREALASLDAALSIAADDAASRALLGDILNPILVTLDDRDDDLPEETIAVLSEAAARRPSEPQYHLMLGRIYKKAHLWQPAEAAFRQAIACGAEPAAHAFLTEVLLELGRPADALVEIDAAGAEGDAVADLHSLPGVALIRLGSLPAAQGETREARPIEPAHPANQRVLTAITQQTAAEPSAANWARMRQQIEAVSKAMRFSLPALTRKAGGHRSCRRGRNGADAR
jgi:tetratricopeptide (TPR) repeat protein